MKRICIMLVTMLALLGSSQAEKPKMGDIIINVSGFRSTQGKAIAYLFRQGDNVMKIDSRTAREIGKINIDRSILVFKNLPFGEYAVMAFHDENNNEKLDHTLGLPAEPMGFSNGFKMGVLSGLPSFDKMRFHLNTTRQILAIRLN